MRAVVRVVAERGLAGLSYRSVAREAGVAHGLVHYHFGSREQMLLETMRWVVEDATHSLGLVVDSLAAADGDEDGLARLADSLAGLSDADRQAHLFANELILAGCRDDEIRIAIEPAFGYVFASVGRLLAARGVEPQPDLVRMVFATIQGLTIQHLFFGSPAGTRAAVAQLQRLLAPGLRGEG